MAMASPKTRNVFIEGLHSPFGMVLVGEDFYVADSDAIMKISLSRGRHQDHRARREAGRPARRHHQSSLDQGSHRRPDGSKLYATVGSNSNVGETASRPRPIARRCSRSIVPAASGACLPPAFAIRTAFVAAGRAARCGSPSMSATNFGNDLVPDYMTR